MLGVSGGNGGETPGGNLGYCTETGAVPHPSGASADLNPAS